jgi:hypothetical protein
VEQRNGLNDGDNINVILPGRNYGWPVVGFECDYAGPRISQSPTRENEHKQITVGCSQRWSDPGLDLGAKTTKQGHRCHSSAPDDPDRFRDPFPPTY